MPELKDEKPIEEFPKWVKGVVVDNADDEAAVLNGTALLHETKSAAGSTFKVVGRK